MSKYVRDKSHSKFEAYTKEDMDNLLEKKVNTEEYNKKTNELPVIHSGTNDPDSSLGKDGDIYLKYE